MGLHVFFIFSVFHDEWVFVRISLPPGILLPNCLLLPLEIVSRKTVRHFVSNKIHYDFHYVLYLFFKITKLIKTYGNIK